MKREREREREEKVERGNLSPNISEHIIAKREEEESGGSRRCLYLENRNLALAIRHVFDIHFL